MVERPPVTVVAATSASTGSSTSGATRTAFREGRRNRIRPEPQCPDRTVALCRRRKSATSSLRNESRSATSCSRARVRKPPGNALPLRYIPVGSVVQQRRTASRWRRQDGARGRMSIQVVAKEGLYATLRLPSTEMRRVSIDCRATLGVVGNAEAELISIGRPAVTAGRASAPDTRCRHEPG